jgi:hypothetical protein
MTNPFPHSRTARAAFALKRFAGSKERGSLQNVFADTPHAVPVDLLARKLDGQALVHAMVC